MKITEKQIDKILKKSSLEEMTRDELLIVLRAVVNEHYNRGLGLDLKRIVELNRNCIVGMEIGETHFLVRDGGRGKVFRTEEEATAYTNSIFEQTKEILSVEQTKRRVTHLFRGKEDD